MKILVGKDKGSYTFDHDAQTLTLSGFSYDVSLEQVLLITNVGATNPMIMYNFADPNLNASISSNVITLRLETSDNTLGMANDDELQIYIDDHTYTSTVNSLSTLNHSLIKEEFDNIELDYVGDNISVVRYKMGATLVATLTLTYTGDNISAISKTTPS